MARLTYSITMGFPETLKVQLKDLKARFTVQNVEQMLKKALYNSFVKGMQERFQKNAAKMALNRRISNPELSGQLNAANRDRLEASRIRAFRILRFEVNRTDKGLEVVRNSLERQSRILDAYQKARYKPTKKKLDSRGLKVQNALRQVAKERIKRMQQVMDILSDPKLMDVSYTYRDGKVNSITVSLGPIAALDKIQVPSATPLITGHPTESKMTSMWRQMEFGTGVFAFPTGRFEGQYKTSAGSWWFGPRKGFGIHFAGTQPGNILRDQTGVLYSSDAMRFKQELERLFNR